MAEEVKQYAAVVEVNNVITEEQGRLNDFTYADLIPGAEGGGDALFTSYLTGYGAEKPPAPGSYGALAQLATLLDGYDEAHYRRIRTFDGTNWSQFYAWEDDDDRSDNAQTEYSNHTLELDDVDNTVVLQNAAVVTIPTNAQVAIPVGGVIHLLRKGQGAVTVVAGATAVRILSAYQGNALRAPGSVARLHKISTNEWSLSGDLA